MKNQLGCEYFRGNDILSFFDAQMRIKYESRRKIIRDRNMTQK